MRRLVGREGWSLEARTKRRDFEARSDVPPHPNPALQAGEGAN